MFERCTVCGRPLISDESRARGMGRVCAKKQPWVDPNQMKLPIEFIELPFEVVRITPVDFPEEVTMPPWAGEVGYEKQLS